MSDCACIFLFVELFSVWVCVCVWGGGDEGGWGGAACVYAYVRVCVCICILCLHVYWLGGGGVYGILHSPCVLQKPWHTPNFHVKLKAGVKKRGFNCRYTGTCSCFDKGFLWNLPEYSQQTPVFWLSTFLLCLLQVLCLSVVCTICAHLLKPPSMNLWNWQSKAC